MLAGPIPTAFRYHTMDGMAASVQPEAAAADGLAFCPSAPLVRMDYLLHAVVGAFLFATLIAARLFRSAARRR